MNNYMVMSLITNFGISVESWLTLDIDSDRRQVMANNGAMAFINIDQKKKIFIVDSMFDPNMGEFIISHEFGHILCREDANDPLTRFYTNDKSFMYDATLVRDFLVLRLEEEFKVDMFALYLRQTYFKCELNVAESCFFSERMAIFEKQLSECRREALSFKAKEMVNNLLIT